MPPAPSPTGNPHVTLQTSEGTIVVELFPQHAPKTVENFLAYVRAGFYPGTLFHRVIKGFVVQGGGYTADMELKTPIRPPIGLEISPKMKHIDGALSMARTEEPNSATSQFYICDGAQRDLDRKYAVFGQTVHGMDVVRRIASTITDRSERPRKNILIEGVYEGIPDTLPGAKQEPGTAAEAVVSAARKLRGRAALLRSRKPLMDFSEVERAIARAESTRDPGDLKEAERLLMAKEGR